MKTLQKITVMFLVICSGSLTLSAENLDIDMTPRVVQGEMIYTEGFPSGESFFIYTREQEEQKNFILNNVVSNIKYNDLAESYNEALKIIEQQEKSIDLWKGISLGVGLTVTGMVLGGALWAQLSP